MQSEDTVSESDADIVKHFESDESAEDLVSVF
jgi:hypothetical protein